MEVKPLRLILIVGIFALVGIVAFWSNMEAAKVQGPSEISTDQLGNVHIRIHQRIFVYNQRADFQRYYDLSDMGVRDIWGGFAFFSNGDILLSPSELTRNSAGINRLNRCTPFSGACLELTPFEQEFKRTYRSFINPLDQIFVSDSRTGKIFWLDSEGNIVEELSEKLKHPNVLKVVGESLVVADTDSYALLLIPLNDTGFSKKEKWTRISTKPGAGNNWQVSRPVDFLRTDRNWVALVKNKGMTKAVLRYYDFEGVFEKEIKVQRHGFIVALEQIGKTLILTDYRKNRVIRYDINGGPLDDLSSPEQEQYIEELDNQKLLFNTVTGIASVVFILLLLVGFIVAIRSELSKKKEEHLLDSANEKKNSAPSSRPLISNTEIKWLARPKYNLGTILAVLVLALMSSLIFMLPVDLHDTSCGVDNLIITMIFGSFIVFVPLILWMRHMRTLKLGVIREWVIVQFPNGTSEIERDVSLVITNNGFIINKRKVLVGNAQHKHFNRKDVTEFLQPRMENAQPMSLTEHIKWEWQHNRRATLLSGGLTGAIVILYILLKFDLAGNWTNQWLQSTFSGQCPKTAQASATNLTVNRHIHNFS